MDESSLHVSCLEVVELVNDYLEGALPPRQTSLVEEHLNFCDGCVTFVEQIRATASIAGRVSEEEIPEATRAKLLTAFRDWKRE